MKTVQHEITCACEFLNRYLTAERGWTSQDVLAAIQRLRALLDELPEDQTQAKALRKTAAQFIEDARARLSST